MNRNTPETFTLLAGLAGLLVLAGQLLGGAGGAVLGLVLGLALVGRSYWFSDRVAVRAARAAPIGREQAPNLHDAVDDLAARAGIAAPRLDPVAVTAAQRLRDRPQRAHRGHRRHPGRPRRAAQTSHYIVNPLTGRRAGFAQLFTTHPPTEQRAARLLGAGQHTR